LAVIISFYLYKVVGWDVDNHMRACLICNAVENTIAVKGCLPKLFRSYRGIQYFSEKLDIILDKKKYLSV